MTTTKTKTTTPTYRIEPGLKEVLRAAAAREHSCIANRVEVLIPDYCGRNGISHQENNRHCLWKMSVIRNYENYRNLYWQ